MVGRLPGDLWDPDKPLLRYARPVRLADDRRGLRALTFVWRGGLAYSLPPAEVFEVGGGTAWRRLRDVLQRLTYRFGNTL